jgi:hypothetical protein
LRDNGFLAVEADTPHQVVCVVPGAPLATADDLFMAALHGVNGAGPYKGPERMIEELARRLKLREGAEPNDRANATHGAAQE